MRVKQQGARNGLKDLRGSVDVPALLEPGVPGNADSGERCDLFAAQSRRAPAGGRRQAHLLGRDPLPPAAQESGQLLPAVGKVLPAVSAVLSVPSRIVLTVGELVEVGQRFECLLAHGYYHALYIMLLPGSSSTSISRL